MQSSSAFTHLAIYFSINLSLSTFNKLVLGHFAYPWLLTASHASFTSIGCFILQKAGYVKLTQLSKDDNLILVAFSTLFTINIAISNVSLAMVSLPFHQIMRSTCPAITVFIYYVVYGRRYSMPIYLSIIPMIIGIGMATYGDYYFTSLGFCLTAFGVVLASVKTVTTNRIMTGSLKLSPLEVLLRMSPLAALQSVICAYLLGEVQQLSAAYGAVGGELLSRKTLAAVAVNSMLAFAQNVSSFNTNKAVGALTLTVCANLKQCFTILLGIFLFRVHIGFWNGLGMFITLAGVFWYSWANIQEKRRPGVVTLPK
ncbi:GDP-mannose transporter GONST5 [Phlyctema vagabunda]|uniref:GDP-mannose transporter GONST5 n=1 Tax=Phlyctema vagabunda TaxID=108571 RepID=A0ABR4PYK4_9HELO